MELDSTTLIFEDLPKNEDVVLISNSYIYKRNTDYFILGLFKKLDSTNNYYLSFIPLKTIFHFPLGAIFKNQQYVKKNRVNRLFHVNIDFQIKKYTPIDASEIYSLNRVYNERFPTKLHNIENIQKLVLNQKHIIVKDNLSNKNIVFPCYEIARWFYMRSSSLTRQLMSCYLEGLYTSAEYIDEEKKHGELHLKYGSSNNDIAEIFRFAKDKFANTMFSNFSISMISTIEKVNDFNSKEFDTRLTLNCTFPIYGNVNIKFNGFNLDEKNIYVYQILEDNSKYPFQSIIAYREKSLNKSNKKEEKQVINKNKPKEEQQQYHIVSKNPNNENSVIELNNSIEYIENLRRDLIDKKISYEQIIEKNNLKSDIKTKIEETSLVAKLSFNNEDSKGEKDCFKTTFNNIYDSEKIDKSDYFLNLKKMINKVLQKKDISLKSSGIYNMPKKPKNDKSKRHYKRSYLVNKQRRKFAAIILSNKKHNILIIEIQKDNLIKATSTAILQNSKEFNNAFISELLLNYSKFNGKWVVPKKSSSKILFLNHPKKYTKESIDNWAERFLAKIK